MGTDRKDDDLTNQGLVQVLTSVEFVGRRNQNRVCGKETFDTPTIKIVFALFWRLNLDSNPEPKLCLKQRVDSDHRHYTLTIAETFAMLMKSSLKLPLLKLDVLTVALLL